MNEKLICQIKKNLSEKSTKELMKIWIGNNENEWSQEAFEAIRRVLNERNVKPLAQKQIEKNPEPFVTKQVRTTKEFITKKEWFKKEISYSYPSICACCNKITTTEFENFDCQETLGNILTTYSIKIPMCSDCQNHQAFWNLIYWSIILSPLLFFFLGILINQYLFIMVIVSPMLGILIYKKLCNLWLKNNPYCADNRRPVRFKKKWDSFHWLFKNETFASQFALLNEGHFVDRKPSFWNLKDFVEQIKKEIKNR